MKYKIFFLVFLFTVPFILNAVFSSYYYTHDWCVQIIRARSMELALLNKDILAHWSPLSFGGYGSPMFLFYSPLYFYVLTVINFFVKNIFFAFQLWHILIYLILVFSSGLLFLKFFRTKFKAFAASFVFLAHPYIWANLYKRGSFLEYFAFIFVLISLYLFLEITAGKKQNYFLNSFVWLFFILAHQTSAFVVFITLILTVVFFRKNLKNIKNYFLSLFSGIGMSLYFSLPVLVEAVKINQGNFTSGVTNLNGFLFEYIFNLNYYFDSLRLPFLEVFIIFIVGFIMSSFLIKKNIKLRLAVFWFVLSFLFSADFSRVLWENVFFLRVMEFPYRFFIIQTVSFSLICAFFAAKIKNKRVFFAFLILFMYVLNINNLKGVMKGEFYDGLWTARAAEKINYYTAEDAIFLPVWFKYDKVDFPKKETVASGENLKMIKLKEGYNNYEIIVQSEEENNLLSVNIPYFDGWNVFVNGRKVKAAFDENGFISFLVPEGLSFIEIRFGLSLFRKLCVLISLGFLILVFYQKKRKIA